MKSFNKNNITGNAINESNKTWKNILKLSFIIGLFFILILLTTFVMSQLDSDSKNSKNKDYDIECLTKTKATMCNYHYNWKRTEIVSMSCLSEDCEKNNNSEVCELIREECKYK